MIRLDMNGDLLLPGTKVGVAALLNERMMSPHPVATSYRIPLNGVKRGSDELLSQSGAVSNGSVLSPPPNIAENNNDAKKVKLDKNQNVNPSKVIHIRNIPNEISEAEIIHLGIPFGRVTNVLVLKGKNQAFLEMTDEAAAMQMVSYFTTCVANLRGRSVYVQYSNHKELKTDMTHSNANASAQAALQAAQALTGNGTGAETQGGPNTVLRVIVDHMIYPVTLDVLHQIFSKYGRVQKIVTFTKNNSFQALIQYPDVVTAQAAKLSLDGQNVYNQCCTLRIEYSKLTTLNVKYNNDKSRDYTNPNLPSGDANLDGLAALGGSDLLPQLLIANSPPRHRSLSQDTQARLAAGKKWASIMNLDLPTGDPILDRLATLGGLDLQQVPLTANSPPGQRQDTQAHLAAGKQGASCVNPNLASRDANLDGSDRLSQPLTAKSPPEQYSFPRDTQAHLAAGKQGARYMNPNLPRGGANLDGLAAIGGSDRFSQLFTANSPSEQYSFPRGTQAHLATGKQLARYMNPNLPRGGANLDGSHHFPQPLTANPPPGQYRDTQAHLVEGKHCAGYMNMKLPRGGPIGGSDLSQPLTAYSPPGQQSLPLGQHHAGYVNQERPRPRSEPIMDHGSQYLTSTVPELSQENQARLADGKKRASYMNADLRSGEPTEDWLGSFRGSVLRSQYITSAAQQISSCSEIQTRLGDGNKLASYMSPDLRRDEPIVDGLGTLRGPDPRSQYHTSSEPSFFPQEPQARRADGKKRASCMNLDLPSGEPTEGGFAPLCGPDRRSQYLTSNAPEQSCYSQEPQARPASAGAGGVLSSPFAGLHGLTSPLSFGGSAVTGGLPLASFQLAGTNTALSMAGLRMPGAGCVLLVTNLNQEMVTPDALFTLFGVYGDVQRVKILYNKKDSALVQMAEPLQAHIAMTHLDKLRLYGKNMNVMPSKHQVVQLPRDGQPDAGLTKDYINSSLHRFKKPGSKNYQNIYPPSATLHLSNIPPTVSEEEIREAFAKQAFQVKLFKFFPKDRKMALLELNSVDDAVVALIKMHNFQLSESNHLRVSFSKSSI